MRRVTGGSFHAAACLSLLSTSSGLRQESSRTSLSLDLEPCKGTRLTQSRNSRLGSGHTHTHTLDRQPSTFSTRKGTDAANLCYLSWPVEYLSLNSGHDKLYTSSPHHNLTHAAGMLGNMFTNTPCPNVCGFSSAAELQPAGGAAPRWLLHPREARPRPPPPLLRRQLQEAETPVSSCKKQRLR